MSNHLLRLFMGTCILLLSSCSAPVNAQEAASRTPAPIVSSPTAIKQNVQETGSPTSTPNAPTSIVAKPPATCPTTRPPNVPFVPPAPYPAKPPPAYVGQFWYGTPELWTMLGADGTWYALPHATAGYTQKVFWWRQGYSMDAEPNPELTVTGRRLDAPASSLQASRTTNASADFGQAMLIGVNVPTLGCWEITGHYHGHNLSFVVWVAP
jgi:hypothetical protein